jgi:hypothetical protein
VELAEDEIDTIVDVNWLGVVKFAGHLFLNLERNRGTLYKYNLHCGF